jgi:lysophospholipase L1-like esterase
MDPQRRLATPRIHRLVAGITVAVCTTGALAVAPPATATPKAVAAGQPTALVTLGDSFMSGEGGRWAGNSNTSTGSRDGTDRAYTGSLPYPYDPHIVYGPSYDNGCNRSDSAEAPSSGVLQNQINLACSGATTANVIRADQGGQPFKGERPQADQLLDVAKQYRVGLIALSIGGNDLGFSDIIAACITDYTLGYPPCNGVQQAQIDKRMAATQQGIQNAIASIRTSMGQDGYKPGDYRIILQSAPSPIPRASEMRYPEGTWERWHTGGCPFWDADATWARTTMVSEISDAFAAVAATAGVDFLDLRDTLQGREVCAVDSSLVDGTAPPSPVTNEWARFLAGAVQGQKQESFHPSYFGQLALGQCLALLAALPTTHSAACLNTPKEGPEGMYLTTS